MATLVSLLIAAAVLAGWIFHIEPLRNPLPMAPAMKFNTALSVFLLALGLLNVDSSVRWWRDLSCSAALALGIATLVEYLGWDLKIDQILVADLPTALPLTPPGRMSEITAALVALMAVAILIRAHRREWVRIWQAIVLLSVFLLGIALFGYAYHANALAKIYPFTQVALDTLFSLTLLNFGLLFSAPNSGFMAAFNGAGMGGQNARRLLPISILTLMGLGLIVRRGSHFRFYDSSFDAVFIVSFGALIIGWLIWRNAGVIDRVEEQLIANRRSLEESHQRSRELAENLKLLNLELEGKVLERTRELELQSTVVRNMAEGVCLVRVSDGSIAYANPKFARMFGYEAGELEGRPVAVLNSVQDSRSAEEIGRDLMRKIQEKGEYSYEVRNMKKDGSPFWCRSTASVFEHPFFGRVIVAVHEDITDRRRTEEALAASEQKYRSLVEGAYDSILVTDQVGRIVFVNSQLGRKFGYDPAELIGQRLDVLVPERFRAQHLDKSESAQASLARSMGAGLDLYARKKDGTEFPVDISLSPTPTPEGKRVTAIIRDVTERKRFEDQQSFIAESVSLLEETMDYEQRIQKIAELSVPRIADACIVRVIEDGKLRFKASAACDPTAVKMLKVASEEFSTIGLFSGTAVAASGQPVLIRNVRNEILQNQAVDESVKTTARTLGANSYLIVPLRVAGRLIGVLNLVMTRPGAAFTEEDLRFAEIVASRFAIAIENARLYRDSERAKVVANNMPALIAYWDHEERCRFANDSCREWFGISSTDLDGKKLIEFLGADLYWKNKPHIEEVLNGRPQRFERDLWMRKLRELRHTVVTYLPDVVLGKVRGFFVLVVDVTELKRLQMAADEARTRAEAAVATREEVLAVVSHDLKSPLAAIGLSAEILAGMEKPEMPVIHDYAGRIGHSVTQMRTLIGNLLDLAKIRSGTFAIEKRRERLETIVTGVTEGFKTLAEAKGIAISRSIPEDLPDVACDPERIAQVIANLLGNAVKFTPEHGKIALSARVEGESVVVSITDSGPGITRAGLDKVFERFWQARETRELGTGLGLSIAQGIVKAHGGKIWVESPPGSGATFSFTIGLARPETPVRPTVSTKAPENESLENLHVLVVDDSADMRVVLRRFLERSGARVSEANSGAEALSLISRERPDVMLTDIEMPDCNGIELIEKVHQLERELHFRLPTAAFTGHENPAQTKRIRDAGFDLFLPKGVAADQLVSSIAQMARGGGSSHELN